jgi:hypothetical protein
MAEAYEAGRRELGKKPSAGCWVRVVREDLVVTSDQYRHSGLIKCDGEGRVPVRFWVDGSNDRGSGSAGWGGLGPREASYGDRARAAFPREPGELIR